LILWRILSGKRRAKLPHQTRGGGQPEDWKSRDLRLNEDYAVTEMCDEYGFLAVYGNQLKTSNWT